MADIFKSEKDTKGAGIIVTGAGVLVKIGNSEVALCQSANLTYQRSVQQIYTLGSESVYTQVGPASGTCAISYIVSTKSSATQFADTAGCDTNGADIVFTAGTKGCSAALDQTITCKGSVMTSIGWQAAAGQGAFTTSLSYTVTSVEATGTSGNGGQGGAAGGQGGAAGGQGGAAGGQ